MMIARFCFLTAVLAVGQAPPADKPQPPPLSEEQTARLRELIRTSRDTATALKARLGEKEQELARMYMEYELNERMAARLEGEIVDLQRQILANYHQMQVRLRSIVGKERFDVLKQRLRLAGVFDPVPPPPKEAEKNPRPAPPPK
jgi:hypothetical protein